jgi:hypothetical protein|tara:strand:+ start:833 stop:1069 length:237 start_codon:yes stop_codon:yes gene_type:complete
MNTETMKYKNILQDCHRWDFEIDLRATRHGYKIIWVQNIADPYGQDMKCGTFDARNYQDARQQVTDWMASIGAVKNHD